MPEYLSPGVYVEEIDAGPKPIEGVSTSTAGAVGVTAFGPTSGKPVLVTSFSEYVRVFGGFLPEPDAAIQTQWSDSAAGGAWWRFPLSVKGFFDNGGQRLYVKRVVSSQATASAAPLGAGLVAQVIADAAAQGQVVRVAHVIGVSEGDTVRIFRGDTGAEVGNGFTVEAYDTGGGRLALVEPLPEPLVERRGDLVQIHAPTAAPVQAADTTLRFAARSLGGWGDALRVRVGPMVGATFNLLQDPTLANNGPFTTAVASSANNASVTQVELADVAAFADGNEVEIDGDTYTLSNPAGNVFEITPGLQAGEEFAAGTVITLLPAGNPPTTTTVATTIVPASSTVQMDDASGLADGDHVQILGVEYELANFDGVDTFEVVPGLTGPQPPFAAGTQVRRLRQAYAAPGTTVNVWGASGLYPGAIVELDNGEEKETSTVASVSGDTVTLDDPLTGRYFEGDKLRVIEAEVAVLYEPVGGTAVEEIFPRLRLVDDGSLSFLVNHLQTRSALVSVTAGAALASSRDLSRFPAAPGGLWQALSGGDDRLDALSPDDFVGVDGGSGSRTGIQALEDIDQISICLAPGIWASIVHSALIQHCELLKDRFAVLDPPDDLDIQEIQDFREPLDTKYAALYYPWIEVRDPSLRRNVDVGPSGHVAGIYARVDVERGVHKAPANEVIRGITRISDDVTHREQGLLNPKGINALRFFPGRGNRVWGARTLSSDASWKYVNVRRLFLFVEESIDEGTQFVVFEPNSDPTWARVRQTITNFLLTVWRSGALEGTKPDQAFFVKCDRTTMSQDDIDNGRLICVIGIAPVKPAEFVIFRIQQKTLESGSAT